HSSTRKATLSALLIGATLGLCPIHAEISANSYDTPAYIDFYLAELTVDESVTEVELVVHRTGEFRRTFQLDYQTVEDTATEGRDYKSSGGTLVFQPQETFKTITVGIIRDEQSEGVEAFTVQLSSTEP